MEMMAVAPLGTGKDVWACSSQAVRPPSVLRCPHWEPQEKELSPPGAEMG